LLICQGKEVSLFLSHLTVNYLTGCHLVAPDINRSVLEWMNDEKEFKQDRPENEWKAFCKSCEDNLGFSPDGDGQLVAAEKLGALYFLSLRN
jgi:hypothetical protein